MGRLETLVLTSLAAAASNGCIQVREIPVSDEESAVFAKRVIDARASLPTPPDCKDLEDAVVAVALQFEAEFDVEARTAILIHTKARVSLSLIDLGNDMLELGIVIDEPSENPGTRPHFNGSIRTTCRKNTDAPDAGL